MRRSLTCLAAAPPLPTFLQLGVAPFWADRLHAAGLVQPTATQALALPPLLAGRSIVLRAETGTGKTLAYLLPILEALRARLASHDPAAQLLPVGLVVAPSIELVTQVCGVARALYPEYANMVLACHGAVGAVRRRNAGLLVATPLAAVEAINPVHLGALRYLVLDEADALLCGALRASMRSSLLPRMKQMMPNARPAHVFCAATIPDKGRDSAHAFLDKWYPAPDTQRIVTQGSHAPPPSVLQTFWQVDATLPLSRLELESQQRAAEAAAALASRESLLGQAGEEGRPGAGEAGEAGGGRGSSCWSKGRRKLPLPAGLLWTLWRAPWWRARRRMSTCSGAWRRSGALPRCFLCCSWPCLRPCCCPRSAWGCWQRGLQCWRGGRAAQGATQQQQQQQQQQGQQQQQQGQQRPCPPPAPCRI